MAPIIEFDTTFKDLYEQHGAGELEIHYFFDFPTCQYKIINGLPVCSKYAYQDELIVKDPKALGRFFNQVVPQWFGFNAGKSNVFMIDLDIPGGDGVDVAPRKDTAEVFSHIAEHQRPTVTYVRDASDIKLPPNAVLSVISPFDCFEHLPPLIPYENHYRALSKRELALSDLPTPPSRVIDTVLNADQVLDPKLREAELSRMLEVIKKQPLPFVIKLPLSHAGLGTIIIRNEEKRTEAIDGLRTHIEIMLGQLNHSNEHLKPTSFVVQDFISGATVAVSMFQPKTGAPIMMCVTGQMEDDQGKWMGSHIDFSQQDRLKEEYFLISEKIGAHMTKLGYYGPLNADIVIGPAGEHYVIDINPRYAGSHILGLSQRHFFKDRGLNEGSLCIPTIYIRMEEFRKAFSKDLEEGSIVIIGWCHDSQGKNNTTGIMLGGHDRKALMDKMEEFKKYGTFSTIGDTA